MTDLPVNPKIVVHTLIQGAKYKTTVYATADVFSEIAAHPEGPAIYEKLQGAATVGLYEVSTNMLRSEKELAGEGVFRFAYSNSKLHRLIGFFRDPSTKREFVILEAFEKARADDYSAAQVKLMKAVSGIYKGGSDRWEVKPLPAK